MLYYNSSLIIVNENYNHFDRSKNIFQYDIGLIKLSESLPITNKINSVCLPNYIYRHNTEELAIFSGWGMISDNFTVNYKRLKVAAMKLTLKNVPYITADDINSGVACKV